ncbi:MAG: hypothetical protein LIP02_15025 [Bacteroidales bacterium]|nr:hypothetical protein [Bacteroidales bacterium]
MPFILTAQSYPSEVGQRTRNQLIIQMPKAQASGILIMACVSPDTINASVVNEFGISLMDFSYNSRKDKVKLHSVMKALDKWYIRRTLRNDLRQLLNIMREGGTEYYDKRHKINYLILPYDETEEQPLQD